MSQQSFSAKPRFRWNYESKQWIQVIQNKFEQTMQAIVDANEGFTSLFSINNSDLPMWKILDKQGRVAFILIYNQKGYSLRKKLWGTWPDNAKVQPCPTCSGTGKTSRWIGGREYGQDCTHCKYKGHTHKPLPIAS